jgi:hypothetical protein
MPELFNSSAYWSLMKAAKSLVSQLLFTTPGGLVSWQKDMDARLKNEHTFLE